MKKLLVVSQTWPEPGSSAAGSRMLQLLHLFFSNKHKITFACSGSKSENAADLSPFHVKKQHIKPNDRAFEDFLKAEKPDIVVFDRFAAEEQFGWRVAGTCPKALRVLDTEDLCFLREARQKAVVENRGSQTRDLFSEKAKREIASVLRCDLSLIISEAEMDLLKTKFRIDEKLLFYLPFLLGKTSTSKIQSLPSFEEREHFAGIGNFRHAPNLDMVFYLKGGIWPLIRRQLPTATLHVYGAYAPKKITELHDPKSGFLVKGRAADSKEVLSQARILLAPLRFGAGLKGKIVEAMECGTPCVATGIGAEGISGNLPFCGNIEGFPEGFAHAAVDLYQNKSKWEEAQKAGFEIINQRFQKEMFEYELLDRLEMLQTNLEEHRRENFPGAMLMHHSMQSTKYMAKWIEAKNDLKPQLPARSDSGGRHGQV